MTISQLRSAHGSKPFQPFVLHLADGRYVPVSDPELMAIAPSGRTIAVYFPDEDAFNMINLPRVNNLEFKPLRNGGRKRRDR